MVKLKWNHFGPIPPVEPDAIASAEAFYLDLKNAFPGYVADFGQRFKAWQGRWLDGEVPGSPDAHECCEVPEYDPILLLGPKTIPLVVYELCKPGNFYATSLYNHIETNPQAKISRDDILNYLILNRQADLIVELNHERAHQARARIDAWKARLAKQRTQNHSNPRPNIDPEPDPDIANEEYEALVEMGPGIIAHVMLEYSRDRAGPWCKLMHQLVCERPLDDMGHSTVGDGREQCYKWWRDWFENREHHEAEEGLVPAFLRCFRHSAT